MLVMMFILKSIKFKGELNSIGENNEKYMTFSVPIKKECDNDKIIAYKLRFIEGFRFMSTSLSELVDNMSENFNSIKGKSCTENNRCEQCKKLIEGLIKKVPSIYKFCNGNLNKFILLLRKGVYPYEDMDSWEKCDETSLPDKKTFYSNLNLEDISDEDYTHAQKVWGVFKIRNHREYHDLYVQKDLNILEICALKYMDLILYILCLHPD